MPAIHYCTHSLGPLLKVTGERCVAVSGMRVAGGSAAIWERGALAFGPVPLLGPKASLDDLASLAAALTA